MTPCGPWVHATIGSACGAPIPAPSLCLRRGARRRQLLHDCARGRGGPVDLQQHEGANAPRPCAAALVAVSRLAHNTLATQVAVDPVRPLRPACLPLPPTSHSEACFSYQLLASASHRSGHHRESQKRARFGESWHKASTPTAGRRHGFPRRSQRLWIAAASRPHPPAPLQKIAPVVPDLSKLELFRCRPRVLGHQLGASAP